VLNAEPDEDPTKYASKKQAANWQVAVIPRSEGDNTKRNNIIT
jgi:hypothetical protein